MTSNGPIERGAGFVSPVRGVLERLWRQHLAALRVGLWLVAGIGRRLAQSPVMWASLGALLVVLVVQGRLERWLAGVPPALLPLGAAALAGLLAWSRHARPARLLPLVNLTASDADKKRFDEAAAAMTEQLDAELRRAQRLRSAPILRLDATPYIRGIERGERPGLERRRPGTLKKSPKSPTLAPSAPHPAPAAAPDFGTIGLGPVRLPIGWLSALVTRWLTHTISGKLVRSGEELVIVAEHSDGRKWTTRLRIPDVAVAVPVVELARELASRIVCDLHHRDWVGADWRAVRALLDGIEQLETHQRTGSQNALNGAGDALAAAAAHAPLFALAHFYLGVVHEYRRQPDRAWALYERARRLDPASSEYTLAVARMELDLAAEGEEHRARAAAALCQRAIAGMRGEARPTHVAHHLLAQALVVIGERRRARRHLRRARRQAQLLLAIERASTSDDDFNELRSELAQIRAAQADHYMGHRKTSRLRQAVKLDPVNHRHRAVLAVAYGERGRFDDAAREIVRTLELDRWSGDARFALALVLESSATASTTGEDEVIRPALMDVAAEVLCRSLDEAPVHADEWFYSARLLEAAHRRNDARELAGVALALDPWSPMRELIGELAPNEWHVNAWLDDWTSAWAAARYRQLEHDDLREIVGAIDRLLANAAEWELPESRLVHHEVAELHRRLGETDAVIAHLADAAHCSVPHLGRAPVDWQLAYADALAEEGRWVKAQEQYERVIATGVAETEATTLGFGGFTIELWSEAVAPAVRARALAGQADVALHRSDPHRALAQCSKAIELEPGYAWPRMIRAYALRDIGCWHEAVTSLEWLGRQIPDFGLVAADEIARIYYERAQAQRAADARSHLLKQAADHYRIAFASTIAQGAAPADSHHIARGLKLARCLFELGERADGRAILQAAAEHVGDGSPDWLLSEAADACTAGGMPAKAEWCLRRAVEQSTAGLAGIAKANGVSEDDRARLLAAAGACNDLAWFLAERSIHLDAAEQHARRAVRFARRTGGQSPDAPAAETLAMCIDTLGWVLYARGRHDDAVRELQRAVELDGTSERRRHLALALEARGAAGDRAAARAQWERIRELDKDSDEAGIAAAHLSENGGLSTNGGRPDRATVPS